MEIEKGREIREVEKGDKENTGIRKKNVKDCYGREERKRLEKEEKEENSGKIWKGENEEKEKEAGQWTEMRQVQEIVIKERQMSLEKEEEGKEEECV